MQDTHSAKPDKVVLTQMSDSAEIDVATWSSRMMKNSLFSFEVEICFQGKKKLELCLSSCDPYNNNFLICFVKLR